MKLVKIKLSSKGLYKLGLLDFTPYVESIEILHLFHYDRFNLFSLQKIVLKDKGPETFDRLLQSSLQVKYYQILDKKGNEYLCILKQQRSTGFWPQLFSEDWTFIPPIISNADYIIFTILVTEEDQKSFILEQLNKFKSIEIMGISNVSSILQVLQPPSPRLTKRQQEIVSFATKQGYFEIPKQISTRQLADHFQLSHEGISSHLQKAIKFLMKFHFG